MPIIYAAPLNYAVITRLIHLFAAMQKDYYKANLKGISLCASGSYLHYWKGGVGSKKSTTHWSDTRKIFSLRWANFQLLLWAYLTQNKELHFQLSNYFCILMYCFWQQDVENKNAVVLKITFMRWWSQNK